MNVADNIEQQTGKGTATIIGIGLIGGSFALALKQHSFFDKLIGVTNNPQHAQQALSLGLVNEVLPLQEAVQQSEFIYIAIPVDATVTVVQQVLNLITDKQTVADAGSTKHALCNAVADHPMRKRFVATHPMWGTEYSGPAAAVTNAFAGRACVITEKDRTDADALALVEHLYRSMGMHLVYMDAAAHDVHAAYVSHISHITSFALANTVLEKEKEEDAIFELAGGGFASTVRLAKSNPAMWAPIFMQNRDNVLDVLNEHISQLRKFKACLEKENYEYLWELMEQANKIKRIIE